MNPPEDLKSAASHRSGEYADYRENIDVTQVHAAVEREHREPEAGVVPIPVWLMALSAFALFWGGTYLGMFCGGFLGWIYNERESSASQMFAEKAKAGAAEEAGSAALDPKALGEKIYKLKCLVCHQPNGNGQAPAFPPLAKSEFVNGGSRRMTMILLKGLSGPVTVNGGNFNGAMPAWETDPVLKDPAKMAAVLTYVRSTWGNTGSPVSPEQVAGARKEYEAHKSPWTAAEILAVPTDAELPGGGAGDAAPAKAP